MVVQITNRNFDITGGPERKDLFERFALMFPRGGHHVTFNVRLSDGRQSCSQVVQTVVTTLEFEDGSGQRFNLKGFATLQRNGVGVVHAPFRAFYDAEKRTGVLSIMSSKASPESAEAFVRI